jgi:hypothetical protein
MIDDPVAVDGAGDNVLHGEIDDPGCDEEFSLAS